MLSYTGIKAYQRCEKIRKRLSKKFSNYSFFDEGKALYATRNNKNVKVSDFYFLEEDEGEYILSWEKNLSLSYGIKCYAKEKGKIMLVVSYDCLKAKEEEGIQDTEDDNIFILDQGVVQKEYSIEEIDNFFYHINQHYHNRKKFLELFDE